MPVTGNWKLVRLHDMGLLNRRYCQWAIRRSDHSTLLIFIPGLMRSITQSVLGLGRYIWETCLFSTYRGASNWELETGNLPHVLGLKHRLYF